METFSDFSEKALLPEKRTGSIIGHAFEMYKGVIIYALIAIGIYVFLSFIGSMFTGFDSVAFSQAVKDSQGDFTRIDPSVYSGLAGYYIVSGIVSLLLAPIFVGLIYIVNKYHNGQQISVSDLFIMYRQNFVQILIYTLIMNAALGIAACLCVFPVIFVAPLFMLGYPVLMFENATAVNALKKSYEIAKNNYGTFLGTSIVAFLISISGIFLCGIGVVLTALFSYAAMYSLYCAYVAKPKPLVN